MGHPSKGAADPLGPTTPTMLLRLKGHTTFRVLFGDEGSARALKFNRDLCKFSKSCHTERRH